MVKETILNTIKKYNLIEPRIYSMRKRDKYGIRIPTNDITTANLIFLQPYR